MTDIALDMIYLNKTEIMLIKGNLRSNVTHEFGNLDIEASTLAPVNSAQISTSVLTLN